LAVPDAYADAEPIYLWAKVNPEEANGWFGLWFIGDQGVQGAKHWEFDNDEDHSVSRADFDEDLVNAPRAVVHP
jgi:hypothetical protein